MKTCTIEGCERENFSFGYCRRHYERWKRHGDPNVCKKPMVDRGVPMQWLHDHSGNQSDDCLIWPFARFPDGRAHMKAGKASRIMCEIVHGPPPTPKHEAAHSCGKAYDGCVNPQHLRWATPVENAADKFTHGTVIVGEDHFAAKLTESDIMYIRSIAGSSTQQSIADKFGVRVSCINKIINRKSWRHI